MCYIIHSRAAPLIAPIVVCCFRVRLRLLIENTAARFRVMESRNLFNFDGKIISKKRKFTPNISKALAKKSQPDNAYRSKSC